MKQLEKSSRRGGSARQVHHKVYCSPIVGQSAKGSISSRRSETSRRQVVYFIMGLTQDRLG